MNKKLFMTSICLSIFISGCTMAKSFVEKEAVFSESQNISEKAENVTGIYKFEDGKNSNEFRILQIGEKQIRAEFIGNFEYEAEAGTTANSGIIEAQIASLENSKAILTAENSPDCEITLKFQDKNLVARQISDCGFPNGVFASGIYRRISKAKPNFDFDEENSEKIPARDENTRPRESVSETPSAQPIPIKFKKGESSTIVRGNIKNGRAVSYSIKARRGQTLEAEVINGSTNNDVVISVKNKTGQIIGGDDNYGEIWKGELPADGEYIISVNTIETENTSYKMSVYIL